jgi:hypothetical protein
MPRKKKSSNVVGLSEIRALLQNISQQLISRREQIRSELREIEELVGSFGSPAPAAARTASPTKSAPAKAGKRRGRPPRSANGKTVPEIVLSALKSASKPMSSSDIMKAVEAQRPGSRPGGVQMVLMKLRAAKKVKAEGKRRSYLYSAT